MVTSTVSGRTRLVPVVCATIRRFGAPIPLADRPSDYASEVRTEVLAEYEAARVRVDSANSGAAEWDHDEALQGVMTRGEFVHRYLLDNDFPGLSAEEKELMNRPRAQLPEPKASDYATGEKAAAANRASDAGLPLRLLSTRPERVAALAAREWSTTPDPRVRAACNRAEYVAAAMRFHGLDPGTVLIACRAAASERPQVIDAASRRWRSDRSLRGLCDEAAYIADTMRRAGLRTLSESERRQYR